MFSLGKAPLKVKTSKQRHQDRVRKASKKTSIIRILQRGIDENKLDIKLNSLTRWRLLPFSECGSIAFLFDLNDSSLGTLIRAIQEYPLVKFGEKKIKTQLTLPYTFATTLFQKNQRIRFCLKSFLNHIRLKKFRYINEVDPVTFEIPKNVIKIINWNQKRIYCFEATSILGDIRARLQHHSYLFPEPLFPRNLITNLPFTLFEIMSVYTQLLRSGHMHWTLESFRHAEYNLKKFALLNYKQLYLKAVYQSIYSDNDKDFLLEFIELQHLYHGYPFDKNLYTWSVYSKTCQGTKKLEGWKRFCYDYHETNTLYENGEEQLRRLNRIIFFTLELCKSTHELRQIRAMGVA